MSNRLCIVFTQPLFWYIFNAKSMSARNPMVGLFNKSFNKPSDLLCCAFGLRNSELDVYFSLISGPKTVEQIAERISKDRSTVQRILNKLHSKGLAKRETHTIQRGGYYYEYSAEETDIVRDQILLQLEEWYQATKSFLMESWSQTA